MAEVSCSCSASCVGQLESGVDSYVAAVYKHNVVLNPEPHVPLTRQEALQHMQRNLDLYEEQAALAAQQGTQIIVFPEDGIHGFNFTRSSIYGYLETIPDPQQESWNPCQEPGRHNNTEVLQRLSCMARRYSLYLVANMPDHQPCLLKTDPSPVCPSNGRWQFNTNVVFNSDGLLVARYHKHNLYYEESFNTPPQPEIITFETPFAGRFGLIICYDILFHDPTVALMEQDVRQLIIPMAWMNMLPLMDSIQFQRAFSAGANVTLLAANLRHDQLMMTGSGIYTPFSATYHHAKRGDQEEGQLIVARVPVLDPLWVRRNSSTGVDMTEPTPSAATTAASCHRERYADPPPPPPATALPTYSTFTSSMMRDPFKFTLLKETGGELTVCDGTFCCHLQYKWTAHKKEELYALGAFAGKHKGNRRYALQVCAVVRCAELEPSSCGRSVEEAESKMDFSLEGRFDTRYVYPAVLASRQVLEEPEKLEKTADRRVAMKHSNMTGGLVTASLYGRMYHLDDNQLLQEKTCAKFKVFKLHSIGHILHKLAINRKNRT